MLQTNNISYFKRHCSFSKVNLFCIISSSYLVWIPYAGETIATGNWSNYESMLQLNWHINSFIFFHRWSFVCTTHHRFTVHKYLFCTRAKYANWHRHVVPKLIFVLQCKMFSLKLQRYILNDMLVNFQYQPGKPENAD